MSSNPTAIKSAIQTFVDTGVVAGAVALVATRDRILSLDAIGNASIEQQQLMRTDTLFWIASMAKPMTATALMMLVEEGKVELGAPVEHYLPEFAGQMMIAEQTEDHVLLNRPQRPIEVHDLLSHTSGLPFMSRVESRTGRIDTLPLDVATAIYAMTPLQSQPGAKVSYSNAGLNTIGRLIEVLGGMPYERFMQDRLFGPLGMGETTFFPSESQLGRLATAYRAGEQSLLEPISIEQLSYPLTMRRYPSPAGGLFSTAEDLALFGQMILKGGEMNGRRYLSAQSIRAMTSTQDGAFTAKPQQPEAGFGYGWATTRVDHGEGVSHLVGKCGHGGAYKTQLWIDPVHGLVTVLLIHHSGPFPPQAGPDILEMFEVAAISGK